MSLNIFGDLLGMSRDVWKFIIVRFSGFDQERSDDFSLGGNISRNLQLFLKIEQNISLASSFHVPP